MAAFCTGACRLGQLHGHVSLMRGGNDCLHNVMEMPIHRRLHYDVEQTKLKNIQFTSENCHFYSQNKK